MLKKIINISKNGNRLFPKKINAGNNMEKFKKDMLDNILSKEVKEYLKIEKEIMGKRNENLFKK